MNVKQRRRLIADAHDREARRLDQLANGVGAVTAREFRARAARLRNMGGSR